MRGRGTPRDRANIKEQRVLPLEEASPTRTRATGSSSEVMPIPNMQAPMMSVVPPIVLPPSTTVANTTVPFQSTPPNAVTVLSAPQWTPPDSTTDIREVQELTRNLRKRISDDDTTNNTRSASGGSSIGTESTLSESIHSESVYGAEHA